MSLPVAELKCRCCSNKARSRCVFCARVYCGKICADADWTGEHILICGLGRKNDYSSERFTDASKFWTPDSTLIVQTRDSNTWIHTHRIASGGVVQLSIWRFELLDLHTQDARKKMMTYHLFFTFSRRTGPRDPLPPNLEFSHTRKMQVTVQRLDQALGTSVTLSRNPATGLPIVLDSWNSKDDEQRIPPGKDLFTGLVFPAVTKLYAELLAELSRLSPLHSAPLTLPPD